MGWLPDLSILTTIYTWVNQSMYFVCIDIKFFIQLINLKKEHTENYW